MTIPVPLAVRLITSRSSRDITRDLRDLTFRTTAPGGFASAQFSLNRPLSFDPDEVAHFGRAYVYDGTGQTVWEGRLEDPGRTAGNQGEVYEIAALGPSAHTRDRTVPLIYVDTRVSSMIVATTSGRAYSVGTRETANAADGALSISAGQGNVVTQLSLGAALYEAVYEAGQDLARISYDWDAGFTSGNTQVQLRTAIDLGLDTLLQEASVNVAGGTLSAALGGAPAIPTDHNRVILTLRRSGATAAVGDDLYWAEFFNMSVLGTRFLADGTPKTSGYTTSTVLSSEVVADLLGRLLNQFDGAGASIATTTYPIEQLAYPDGATAEKVLSDLMELDGGYLWEALESNAAGKYRFVWRAWPSSVRYEADMADGYSAVSSGADLYNAVRVRYRDSQGVIRNVRRTQTVPVLADAGLTREAFVDLGDEVSTLTNAQRVGDEFLAEHLYAANAGRLTIARRILDMSTGRMVDPWEIRPGYFIRVRGLNPRVDVLNTTGRDGSTVFKIAAVDYSLSDTAAQLELDTNVPSLARTIGDIMSRPVFRRR